MTLTGSPAKLQTGTLITWLEHISNPGRSNLNRPKNDSLWAARLRCLWCRYTLFGCIDTLPRPGNGCVHTRGDLSIHSQLSVSTLSHDPATCAESVDTPKKGVSTIPRDRCGNDRRVDTFRALARGDTFSFVQHTRALLSIRNSVYTCIPPFKWVKSSTLIKPTKIYIQYQCIIQLEHTVCPSDLGSRIHKVPLLMGTSPDHYEPPLSNY